MLKNISRILALGIIIIASGCAASKVQHTPLFLSSSYNDQVKQEIHVIPIIDARAENKDRHDIKVPFTVKADLEDKGYAVSKSESDVKECMSVANIKSLRELSCLATADLANKDMILIFSIDEYTPPSTWSFSGMAFVSGVLYDVRSDTILWKDAIRKGDDSEAYVVSMYGGGGYLGGLLVKALAPNVIFRNAAFASINAIMKTFPKNPRPVPQTKTDNDSVM